MYVQYIKKKPDTTKYRNKRRIENYKKNTQISVQETIKTMTRDRSFGLFNLFFLLFFVFYFR